MRSSDFEEFIEILPPNRIQEPPPQQAVGMFATKDTGAAACPFNTIAAVEQSCPLS